MCNNEKVLIINKKTYVFYIVDFLTKDLFYNKFQIFDKNEIIENKILVFNGPSKVEELIEAEFKVFNSIYVLPKNILYNHSFLGGINGNIVIESI